MQSKIKHHSRLKVALLLLCFAFYAVASYEPFKKVLDGLPDAQEKLAFVTEQQDLAQSWSLEDLGRFYHQKGLVLEANDQIEAAKAAYTESIDTFTELDVPNGYWVQSLQDRSYMDYLITNDPTEYCVDRQAAVEVARKTEDASAKTSALVFLAFCYQDGFDAFKEGLAVLDEAATIAQQNNLAADATAMIHNATGNLYRTNQIDDKAYEYYQKAYDHWETLDDRQDMFNMQHNLAGEAIKLGRWEAAEKHIKTLFELSESSPDFSDFEFFARYNQAMLTYTKNDFKPAIIDIKAALDLAHTTAEQYFINALKGIQVVAYFRNNEFDQAGILAEAFLASGKLSPRQQELNNQVKLIDEFTKGKYQSSMVMLWSLLDETKKSKYAFFKNSVALQAINFDQSISQFQEQALASKLKISELELEKSTKQNKINQLTGIAAALLALVFIVFSFYLYKSRQFYLRSSRTDFLTRSHNRRRIFELGKTQLKQVKNHPFSVAILDIDDFKNINDRYGHDLGDQVLVQLVTTIKGMLTDNQTLGRMGGEEFLLLFPNTTPEEARNLAESIRQSITKTAIIHQGSIVKYSVSIGVFGSDDDNMTFEKLIKQADLALYEAKNTGKNKAVLQLQK
jgi:diguanylate cyclase (GGDEF)-like protein